MIENRRNLKQFMKCGVFSRDFNNLDQTIEQIEMLIRSKKKIRITYGETYDQYGLTIDSLKYYLSLSILDQLITELGGETETSIIVGNLASLRNIQDKNKEGIIKNQTFENRKLIEKFIEKNDLNIGVTLMSDLFQTNSFKRNLKLVTKEYKKSAKLRKKFETIVLKNRLKQEYEKDFLYSREEISLIMNYQIKIGPPREKKYDDIANLVMNNSELIGLYLNPTYPLGLNYDYFIQNEEIERYGLTPYKAGSNKLQKNRIILGSMKRDELRKLLEETFRPSVSELPDPMKDLFIILDLLQRLENNDFEFSSYNKQQAEPGQIIDLINKYLPELYG